MYIYFRLSFLLDVSCVGFLQLAHFDGIVSTFVEICLISSAPIQQNLTDVENSEQPLENRKYFVEIT